MPTQECRFPAFPGAWWWGKVAGGPGPCGGEPHLDSTFGVVGRSGWGTHLSRRLGGLWAGSSSQGLDVRLASGAGRGREAWALACPLVCPTSPLCGGHTLAGPVPGGTSRATTTSRLARERDLVGCVVLSQGVLTWELLALTPDRPEARDAQSHPTCAGYRQALGISKRWAYVAGGRHW